MIPCTQILKGVKTVHHDREIGPLFVWNVTSRCNLRCGHCYRGSHPGQDHGDLSDDKCMDLIKDIKTLNPPIVLLTGGEPLIRKNIFDMIRACKDLGLRVGLSTNGTLIDEDMAEKICRNGVDYVGISIDGRKDVHDAFRGTSGAFEASWRALKLLNERGVKTGVRFTLTKANYRDLPEIMNKTAQIGTKRFCLYHLVYSGRASRDLDMRVAEKRKCMDEFFKQVQELSLSDPLFQVLTTDNPADGIFMAHLLGGETNLPVDLMCQGGCSAGDRVVYLDSTGDVYPCQFLRYRSLGNVKDKPLGQIWQDPGNEFLSQLRNKKDFLTGRCGYCDYKAVCGGCRARAKAYYGSVWAQDPACYLEDSETNSTLRQAEAVFHNNTK